MSRGMEEMSVHNGKYYETREESADRIKREKRWDEFCKRRIAIASQLNKDSWRDRDDIKQHAHELALNEFTPNKLDIRDLEVIPEVTDSHHEIALTKKTLVKKVERVATKAKKKPARKKAQKVQPEEEDEGLGQIKAQAQIRWVAAHIRKKCTVKDAPDRAAWNMLKWVEKDDANERHFWTVMWTKTLPSRAQLDEDSGYNDDGSNCIDAIEDMLRIRDTVEGRSGAGLLQEETTSGLSEDSSEGPGRELAVPA